MTFIVLQYYSNNSSTQEDSGSFWFALLFFLPLFAGIAYLIYITRFNKQWEKGLFPADLPYTRDNLLEAYICLAAYMIQRDSRERSVKVQYMNSYFISYFPESHYDFSDSLVWSYQNPVKPATVANWINKHVQDPVKRSQVLYFLVGISMSDGELIENEYKLLKEITPLLKLDLKELDSILGAYAFKEKRSTKVKSETTNYSRRAEIAHQVLGLNAGASIQEIKAAYRTLVKTHHPDRFANEAPEQVKIAHERFLKIQDAYELLNKLKGG